MTDRKTGPFSPENIAKAIERVPTSSTKQIKIWLDLAREKGLPELQRACEAEIEVRPVEFDGDAAQRHARTDHETTGMSLQRRIEHAFTNDLPASPEEVRMARVIAARPGISHSELSAAVGKRDTSLVIGHFVYDRFGCFRSLIVEGQPQSSVLFERTQTDKGVCYAMKPETEAAFRKIGII